MKKLFTTISIIALAISNMIAGPVDQQTAQRIGENFLKTTSLGQKTDIQLNLVSTALTKGAIDYYIFNLKGEKGFVVVSGDDRVKPILAYSTEGSYSTTDVADGFRFTLNSYREEIQYVREHNIAATPDITAEWQSIEKTGYIRQNRNQRTVDILLETTWNQNYPYNSQCPEDEAGSGGHVYAGCVATAMAQVIKYYNHPTRGIGSYSYTPGGQGYPYYPTQTANFGETDYHFELMPNNLDSLSTDGEIFYIAQLLHHLGISVAMMYGPDGSGAISLFVGGALHQYFGFTDANHCLKLAYTNEEWIAALKNELDKSRPVFYDGNDPAGGHAFVCDGYDENDYFHFNWGWSGVDDGYYAMGALNTTRYTFNLSNAAIFDLYPETEDYDKHPERIANLALTENDNHDGVTLTWNNPANDNSGNALATIDSVFVRRNFEVIATFTNTEPGAEMSFSDLVPESRIYEYSVYVKNSYGASIPVYQDILIGKKCDMFFQLNDAGGNGWKGAAISVVDENGNRIAIINMEDGAQQLKNVPLLRGDLRFFWNHGWFHSSEEYDTDYECSFSIMDSENNVIFTSPSELTDGEFFTCNNNCENTVVSYLENGNAAKVYPNPTNGMLNINANGLQHITIINLMGQIVCDQNADADFITIDMNQYGNGVYMVRIETANSTSLQKVNVMK